MPEKRARIFIVDDDQGLLRLLRKTLEREGFETASAGSGREAIKWLSQNAADLLFLDLKLEDLEGRELISHLASIGRSVPFIIITGQGDERVAVEMMKQGALDYLVKDMKFMEFVPAVVHRSLEKLETDRRLAVTQAALEESRQQLLLVSEREQRLFGSELHDGLGQQLTAIELMCESLKQDLPAARPDLEKQIGQICQLLRDAITQTRALARGLSPFNLDSRGLTEALDELAARMSKEGRIQCRVESPATVQLDDIFIAGHLFRIAQEAVTNAVKHSRASSVVIRLFDKGGALHLEVADNGKGFPESPRKPEGIGLQIMKHRASVVGGNLEVKSAPGRGVTVSCVIRRKRK